MQGRLQDESPDEAVSAHIDDVQLQAVFLDQLMQGRRQLCAHPRDSFCNQLHSLQGCLRDCIRLVTATSLLHLVMSYMDHHMAIFSRVANHDAEMQSVSGKEALTRLITF